MDKVENVDLQWMNIYELMATPATRLSELPRPSVARIILQPFHINFCTDDGHITATIEEFRNNRSDWTGSELASRRSYSAWAWPYCP